MIEKQPFLQGGLSDDDDNELPSPTGQAMMNRIKQNNKWKERCWILFLATLLSCFSAFLGTLATIRWQHQHMEQTCIGLTSHYSPLTKDVDITYHTVRFNGSLLKENVYRQKAGPEVDAAWDELGVNFHSVVVPTDQAERAGLASDQVKIRQEYGGGFPANVEGLHQLHCLNLVRQALFYNYDYYQAKGEGAFGDDDYVLQKHISHCLDIVRQQLMCTVDIGVMGQVWFQPPMSEYPETYVDFNTQHVCRNFENVRKWAEDHQIPADIPDGFLEAPSEGDRVYHTIP